MNDAMNDAMKDYELQEVAGLKPSDAKWDYVIKYVPDTVGIETLETVFLEMGRQGWEFAAMLRNGVALFKRELELKISVVPVPKNVDNRELDRKLVEKAKSGLITK